MKNIKLGLIMLLILGAFSCSIDQNEGINMDKLSSISDLEIIEFKAAVFKKFEKVNYQSFGKYRKYATYDDFVANTNTQQQNEMIKELNIKPIKGLALLTKINDLKLSNAEFDRLKKRINDMPIDMVVGPSEGGGGSSQNCENICFDYQMSVYWTKFHDYQNSGMDMYSAHDYATLASGYAYLGCLYGCNAVPQ